MGTHSDLLDLKALLDLLILKVASDPRAPPAHSALHLLVASKDLLVLLDLLDLLILRVSSDLKALLVLMVLQSQSVLHMVKAMAPASVATVAALVVTVAALVATVAAMAATVATAKRTSGESHE